MSKKAAEAFLTKIAQDPALQESFVAFARGQGYDFNVEELTDAELGDVAGGVARGKIYPKVEILAAAPATPERSSPGR
jgi:nitrogen fixation uncharacterized protein